MHDYIKPGAFVSLRNGSKAKIYDVIEGQDNPIIGAVRNTEGHFCPLSWREDGENYREPLEIVGPWKPCTVAVDFDGVLCRKAWPGIGDSQPGFDAWLRGLRANGWDVVLWTCRTGEALDAALAWLAERGFPRAWWDAVNENTPSLIEKYGTDPRKLGVTAFVDDNAVGFPMDNGTPDWKRINSDLDWLRGKP